MLRRTLGTLAATLIITVGNAHADQLDLGNPIKPESAPVEAQPVVPGLPRLEPMVPRPPVGSADEQITRLQLELREARAQNARLRGTLRRMMPLLERAADAGHLRPAVVESLKAAMEGGSDDGSDEVAISPVEMTAPSAAVKSVEQPPSVMESAAPKPVASRFASDEFGHIEHNIFARKMKLVVDDDKRLHLRGEMRNLTFKSLISVGLKCVIPTGEGSHETLFYVTFSEIEQTRSVDVVIDGAGNDAMGAGSAFELKVLAVDDLR